MKASVSPAVMFFAFLIGLSVTTGRAEDLIVQKDGVRREGQILAVKAGVIRLKVGPVETTVPMANVASVTMAPPKEFTEALSSWSKGNAAATLPLIKGLVEKFPALPTKWAERASALLGEALLATGNVAGAEVAFANFQKAYPDAGTSADVGLARLAIEKKDFAAARAKLSPIVEAARKTEIAKSGDCAVFGQALYLMGRTQEAAGENSEALESYLLAANIFREDEAVVSESLQRAKSLKEKNVIVP